VTLADTAPVLVVAAHPDDEVLGCGGTVAGHAAAGRKVHVLILAEGATARDARRGAGRRQAELAALRRAARAAARVLGAAPPEFCGLPDNRLDSLPLIDVVKRVERVVERLRPAIVYTHHGGDLNVDHRIAHAAVLTACRPVPGASVARIYAFETVSSSEWAATAQQQGFQPTHFVDIAAHLAAKARALDCYAGEMRAFPHPRSPEAVAALASWRGASVGLAAAEAFVVVRQVEGAA